MWRSAQPKNDARPNFPPDQSDVEMVAKGSPNEGPREPAHAFIIQ